MNALKRAISPKKQQNELTTKKVKLSQNCNCRFKNGSSPASEISDVMESTELNSSDYDKLFGGDDDFELIIDDKRSTEQQCNLFDLSKWQRCIVEAVERERRTFDLVLRVRVAAEIARPEIAKEDNVPLIKCYLQQQWSQTEVKVGDIVSLQAAWCDQLGAYRVTIDHGYCVVNPDMLVSSTSVVGSLFCRRKGVLQDRFKGIDANSKVMVIGSFVHELLQSVLQKELKTSEEVETELRKILESRETTFELYSNRMTLEELDLELQKFVPNVIAFVTQYIKGREPAAHQQDCFQGTIDQIQDIEENVWAPQLGLKGKVDVSVRIKRRAHENTTRLVPLELKTGRATFSMEHKGQVVLYQMMLSTIGRETSSSLLLYLREGLMREVCGTRNEQRDLIMLRNDLVHYLSYVPPLPPTDTYFTIPPEDGKYLQPLKLPEPISHHSACGNCEYATICSAFANTDPQLRLRNGHPFRKVMQTATDHLRPADYGYFIRWTGLLALEELESRMSPNLRALWTDTPEQRQKNGRAISGIRLKEVSSERSRFMHKFVVNDTKDSEGLDLLLSGFSIGEYVTVGTRKRLAIAAGCITEIANFEITISLERDLRKNYGANTFIIDKHESQSGNGFNFTNISLLLEDNERAKALREIVVHQTQPNYYKVLPKIVATAGAAILKVLNSVQRSAVLKAVTTESYMLIKGLPGTGKTQTLMAIVRLLHLMGKSVLITSHTHSAVDNLLIRLKPYKLPMLRLGVGARFSTDLQEYNESILLKDCHTIEALTKKYNSYNIVGVTCLGSSHPLFLHRKFDFCIVDEATQVMQPTILRPLFFCDKFILVGDPDQLPPLVRSKEARLRGADESLFHRLDSKIATSILTLQYRMNKAITRLANELTYNGTLQCASKEVELASLQLRLPSGGVAEKWLHRALQTHIDQAVCLLDTTNCAERSYEFGCGRQSSLLVSTAEKFENDDSKERDTTHNSTKQKSAGSGYVSKYINYCEAAIIIHIVQKLLEIGYAADRIGIIAPYRAQVEMLRKLCAQCHSYYQVKSPELNFGAVEVNTVDQYQGRDKDIILYSGTKTGALEAIERAHDTEILEDKRRLTVAITRAKRKLLLVGDAACLHRYTPFRLLFGHIPSYCKFQLENGKLGFDWRALFKRLSDMTT